LDRERFLATLQEKKNYLDDSLPLKIESLDTELILKESMLYSILAGGKRLRPTLLLMTIEAFGKDSKVGIDAACAVEMIHTYSLIHDDLPAMDDDDFRRGSLTNHKIYGEALAILAGDGLLTNAIQVLSCSSLIDSETKIDLITALSKSAGPEGMVAGQVADMEAEGRKISIEALERIHHKKTGALLAFSVYAGARIAKGSEDQIEHLTQFAKYLGLAFQIQDDILDVEGDQSKLGKPIGSDKENNKMTYPHLLSLNGAKEQLLVVVKEAKKHLYNANVDAEWLEHFTDYMISRDH
jgi:geranylgeranyl diphosphate synthase type II